MSAGRLLSRPASCRSSADLGSRIGSGDLSQSLHLLGSGSDALVASWGAATPYLSSWKPRPMRTSSRSCSSLGPSVGSGKSLRPGTASWM